MFSQADRKHALSVLDFMERTLPGEVVDALIKLGEEDRDSSFARIVATLLGNLCSPPHNAISPQVVIEKCLSSEADKRRKAHTASDRPSKYMSNFVSILMRATSYSSSSSSASDKRVASCFPLTFQLITNGGTIGEVLKGPDYLPAVIDAIVEYLPKKLPPSNTYVRRTSFNSAQEAITPAVQALTTLVNNTATREVRERKREREKGHCHGRLSLLAVVHV